MARNLGEARVSVLPDSKKFKPEVEAQIKKAMAGVDAKVKLNANDDELRAKLARAEAAIHKVTSKKYSAKVGLSENEWNVQVAKLKTQLEALSHRSVHIKTSLDRARFEEQAAKLAASTEAIGRKLGVKVKVNLNEGPAEREGVALREKLKAILSRVTVRVKVDRDRSSFSRFFAALGRDAEKAGQSAGNNVRHGLVSAIIATIPILTTLFGAASAAAIGLGGSTIAAGGALLAYGAVAKPVLGGALTASKAVDQAQKNYQATLKSGVPTAQAHAALTAANSKAQIAYNAALQSNTKPANAQISLHKALAQNQVTYNAAVKSGIPPAKAHAALIAANSKAQIAYNSALQSNSSPAKAQIALHKSLAQNQVTYNAAVNSGTAKAKAYQQQQAAINKAYAGMSPQQIALSKQLGAMADAWDNVKAKSTPLIAGSLQPWLKSITSLTKDITPIIAKVAPAVGGLGNMVNSMVTSSGFTTFRNFIANQGSYAVKQDGGAVVNLIHAFIVLLPKFSPLINEASRGIGDFGRKVLAWSNSRKSSQEITNFMEFFHKNAPTIAAFIRNLAGAIKAISPGLTSGGLLEIRVLSDFLGWIAKLPPSFVKPITEVAGALLILNKLGLVKVGLKIVGVGAKALSWLTSGVISIGSGSAAAAKIEAAMVSGGEAAGAEIRAAMAGGGATSGAASGGKSAAGGAAAGGAASKAKGLLGGIATKAAGVAGGALLAAGLVLRFREDVQKGLRAFLKDIPLALSGAGGFLQLAAKGWADKLTNPIRAKMIQFWDKWVGPHVAAAWHVVARETENIWSGIVRWLVGAWNQIKNHVSGAVGWVRNKVSGGFHAVLRDTENIWGGIVRWLVGAWNNIKGHVLGAVSWVRDKIAHYWNVVKNDTTNVWGGIVRWLVGAWNNIKGHVLGAVSWVRDKVAHYWNVVKNDTTNVWGGIVHWLSSAWDRIRSDVSGAVSWIRDKIAHYWNVVKNDTTHIWGDLTHWLSGTWDSIKRTANDAVGWVRNKLAGTWTAIKNDAKTAWRTIADAIGQAWTNVKKAVVLPINFVIQHIWNPFAHFVDSGLSAFGIKQRLNDSVKPIKLARGGHVPGYAPGSDTVPAMLSPGEFVLNPTAVRAVGIGTLSEINNSFKPGGSGRGGGPGAGHFASGGGHGGGGAGGQAAVNAKFVQDAERYKGHKYVWGGASNPQQGWDCSSFVGYVLGHDFGLSLPGGAKWNPHVHGPTATQYKNTPGFGLVSHSTNDIRAGDLLVENSGGHVGFGVGPNRMFSAYGRNFGTLETGAANMNNVYRWGGGNLKNVPGGLLGVLKAFAQKILNGIGVLSGLTTGKIPGTGPFHELPVAIMGKIISAAKAKLLGNQSNYNQPSGGGGPAGGPTGTDAQNMIEGYKYLKQNLFSGSKVGAAGAVASIAGESNWNPSSQGTGGRGLIGWTPPSTISDAAFRGGMRTQLPEIIHFVNKNGDMGAVRSMEHASSVMSAAQTWDHKVERAGINDVHSGNVAAAEQIMQKYATGGVVRGKKAIVKPKARTGLLGLSDQFNADQAQYAKLITDSHKKGISKSAKAADLKKAASLKKAMARIQGMTDFTPLNIQHDELVAKYKAIMATEQKIRTRGLSKAKLAQAKAQQKSELAQAKGIAAQIKAVDRIIGDPVGKVAYRISQKEPKAWTDLSAQLMHHSTNPKGIKGPYGAISSAQVKDIALHASGDMLDALYGGPQNYAALATAMKGSTNIFGKSPLSTLPDFGKLAGIHGSYKGVKFAQGGRINEHVLGVGTKSGMPYSFGEGGRRERVLTDSQSQQFDSNAQTNQLLLSLLAELKRANEINAAGLNAQRGTNKALGGIGHHIL